MLETTARRTVVRAIAALRIFLPFIRAIKNPGTFSKALPPLVLTPVDERAVAPAAKSIPNNHIRNTIRYDINRAEAALRDGRYDNAIWHLERAIALDPDNRVLRDRLSSARRARSDASGDDTVDGFGH